MKLWETKEYWFLGAGFYSWLYLLKLEDISVTPTIKQTVQIINNYLNERDLTRTTAKPFLDGLTLDLILYFNVTI